MRFLLRLTPSRKAVFNLLNWLATENARQFRVKPGLPGVLTLGRLGRARPGADGWGDIGNLLVRRGGNSAAAAAALAGELRARGGAALGSLPGGEPFRGLGPVDAQVVYRRRRGSGVGVEVRVGRRVLSTDVGKVLGLPKLPKVWRARREMDIPLDLTFREQAAANLLQWLAEHNARVLKAHPRAPLLYDSGVVYRREEGEVWADVLVTLRQGHEDCDGLAAARAGELMARGARALRPGDKGADRVRAHRGPLPVQTFITTRVPEGRTGLYHCVLRYAVGGQKYVDDPSARLGMRGRIDPAVAQRWAAKGISARA